MPCLVWETCITTARYRAFCSPVLACRIMCLFRKRPGAVYAPPTPAPVDKEHRDKMESDEGKTWAAANVSGASRRDFLVPWSRAASPAAREKDPLLADSDVIPHSWHGRRSTRDPPQPMATDVQYGSVLDFMV